MKTLYLSAPSGISGNMTLAALLEIIGDDNYLLDELKKLHLEGYEIIIKKTNKNHIHAKLLEVKVEESHVHRHLSDINKINLDSYHLTKILGIFLDNAIEASKECSKKIINISFKYSNNKQLILVENTYLNKNISIKKIFEKNFSSKLNHSGLGLWEVNKIVNKHKNLNLYTITDNNFFTQKLEIL